VFGKFTTSSKGPGFSAIAARLSQFGPKSEAKAGVFHDTSPRSKGDITNAELASIHEFGTATIPERSFMRSAFRKNKKKYIRMAALFSKRVARGDMKPKQAMDLIALEMAEDQKRIILGNTLTPLAAKTIERKGSSRPLIDTGQLINAIQGKSTP